MNVQPYAVPLTVIEQVIPVEGSSHRPAVPYINELLPSDQSEINEWVRVEEEKLKQFFSLFEKSLKNEDDENAIYQWHEASQVIQMARPVLTWLVPERFPGLDGATAYKKLAETFRKHVVSESFQRSIVEFLKAADLKKVSPYQIGFFQSALAEISKDGGIEGIQEAREKIEAEESVPYSYARGGAKEKKEPVSSMRVLSWNILSLPGNFSWYFGGVPRWDERIDAIVQEIKEVDADIIALQEVCAAKVSLELRDKLSDTYAHIYYRIKPGDFTFDPDKLWFDSGCFVASKYPLEQETAASFIEQGVSSSQKGICKSFFSGAVKTEEGIFMRFFTTHLSPGNKKENQETRREEARLIINEMKAKEGVPSLLTGDLNVPYGREEWLESPLRVLVMNYPSMESTCTEDFNNQVYREGAKDDSILDYGLMHAPEGYDLSTEMRRAYNVDESPWKASSDHQKVITTVTKPKKLP